MRADALDVLTVSLRVAVRFWWRWVFDEFQFVVGGSVEEAVERGGRDLEALGDQPCQLLR